MSNRNPPAIKNGLASSAVFAAIFTGFIIAMLPVSLTAQVSVGLPGTLYFGPQYPSFVTDQPCHSYVINLMDMEPAYPDLVAKLHALRPGPVTLTLSLQPVQSITPDGRSSFLVTSIDQLAEGVRDTRKLCTSETPGGYYEGVLSKYRLGAWYGYLVLDLSGSRQLYVDFPPKEPPLFDGKPLLCPFSPGDAVKPSCEWPSALSVGRVRVRVYVMNRIDPNGDSSQVPTRIVLTH